MLGDLNGQQGWLTTNTANIQIVTVLSGSQAVEIASSGQAVYATSSSEEVVWFELQCLPTASSDYPDLPAASGATCLLFFHSTGGITCLDGNGAGSGAWSATGIAVTDWTRIAIRQDFSTNTWDLYVNGIEILSGLGNAYGTTALENMEFNAGSAGSMLLDEMHSGTEAALPPMITDISDHTIKQGKPYSLLPSLSQASTFDVTWSFQGSSPTGMTIDSTTGQIDWISASAASSPYGITLRCSSSTGYDEEGFSLTVNIPIVPETSADAQWILY
ncbi:hypothetical protein JXA32_09000 [Candidatus Sumerlaeota bacterium]|nr:hypothetical protein [Candidatus Sumerlaeota bacterium]